jgi:hypothetical protein
MRPTWVGLFCLALAAWSQSVDPKKLSKIEGRTVNARTGEPVPRVTLTLTGSGQNTGPRSGRSDNDGQFLIDGIPPGSYRLTAERVGFLRQGYGSRTPGGSGAPLNFSDSQYLKDVVFRLTPQGVIMGLVTDEDGDPLARTNVSAYRQGSLGAAQAGPQGGMRGGAGQQVSFVSAMTNDVGEYRLAGLSPGRYVVVASSQAGVMGRGGAGRGGSAASDQAPVPTYYPSATDPATALPIDIAPGQEIAGISIAIRKGALYRIQGRVVGASPQELAGGVGLLLMPRGAGGLPFMGRGGAQAKPDDGSFEMNRVQPGSYYIVVQRTGRQGGGGIVGKTMLDVSGTDITGLLVTISEPLTVSGSVKVDGQQSAELQRLSLTLMPGDALGFGAPSGRVSADGAFKITGVFPDRYYLNVNGLPDGAYVKSVKLANQEVLEKGIDLSNFRTNAAFDVVLSLKGATLEGTVTIDDKPATGSTIAVLADPFRPGQPYLNKFATADQDGKFTIRGLAPGDYKVYAFEEAIPELSLDPGLAKPFEPRAVKVDLDEGATERVELKALKPDDARQ